MSKESRLDTNIIAALIGLVGVVITVVLSSPLFVPLFQHPPASSPTASPASALATETNSPFTPTPTLAPGKDFQNECIASGNWDLYPEGTFTPNAQGCWDLSSWGISAQSQGLVLLLTSPSNTETHALYTQSLSKNANIDFILRIDALSTASDKVGNIALGIVSSGNTDPLKRVLLLFQIEGSQPSAPIYLKTRDQATEDYVNSVNNKKLGYSLDDPHEFTFRLEDISLTIYQDAIPIAGPFNVPSARGFWIGYTVPSGGNLSAVVSNLSIQSQ